MSEKLCVLTQQSVLEEQFTIYGSVDEPLFFAKDVANRIEHSNVSVMLSKVDEDEKQLIQVGTLNNAYSAWFLTEDGLYEVLMQSRKPIAKQFKKQIKKILKGLRKGEIQMSDNTLNVSDMQAVMKSVVDTNKSVVDSNNNTAACMQQMTQMMSVMVQMLQNNNTTSTNTTPQTETQTEQSYIDSCVGVVTGKFYTMTQIAKDITKNLDICCDAKKLNRFLCDNDVLTKVKGYAYKGEICSNFYILTEEYRNTYDTVLVPGRNRQDDKDFLSNVYKGNFRQFIIKLVKDNREQFLNS